MPRKDFSEFLDAEAITVSYKSREWVLPSVEEVSALVVASHAEKRARFVSAQIQAEALQKKNPNAKVPDALYKVLEEAAEFTSEGAARELFGDELVDSMFEANLPMPLLGEFYRYALGVYEGRDEDDGEGEAQAPSREQRRARAKASPSKQSSTTGA